MKKKIFTFLLLFFSYIPLSFGENISVFQFTEEEKKILKIRKIKKTTNYTLGSNEKGNYLKAEAKGQASGLGIEKKINLNTTPIINITWKVEKDLQGIDERSKKGHDYAARVFVVKKTGATPLSNRAMNYVFSSNENVNVFHPSPYTKKSIDYVLATTKNHLNEGVTVKVNVKDHFKKFHNIDLDEINGVAIMADTDNSKLSSVAYYQNIYFSSE